MRGALIFFNKIALKAKVAIKNNAPKKQNVKNGLAAGLTEQPVAQFLSFSQLTNS